MDLQFKKEGTVWVAEFEATSDFNLHLERVDNGSVVVAQSGIQGGEYDVAFRKNMYEVKNFDYDFGALVYPKYIKVTSGSEVIKGVVNFNVGGGSGSSSGGSEASTVEYLQFESTLDAGVFMEQAGLAVIDAVVSVTFQGISITQAAPINVMLLMKEQADEFSMTKLSADWNHYIVIKTPDGNIFKGKAIDYILSSGITQEQLDAVPRITKEEFYNISE